MTRFEALRGLWLVPIIAAAAATAQTTQPTISLTIKAEQDVVQAGSAVKVQITITNVSKQKIGVQRERNPGHGEIFHEFDIRDADGNPAPESNYQKRLRANPPFLSLVPTVLAPGESAKDEATLSKLYDLSLPGEYTVQARRYDNDSRTLVKSNTVKIRVQ